MKIFKNRFPIFIITIFFLGLFFIPIGVYGADSEAQCPKDRICLENPLGTTNILEISGNAIKVVTGIMGSIALVVFVYGGFMWLTAAGNEEHIKKGTQAMIWATIGIIVVFSSYAIIGVILEGIVGSKTAAGPIEATKDKDGCYCVVDSVMEKNMPYTSFECTSKNGTTDIAQTEQAGGPGLLSDCKVYKNGQVVPDAELGDNLTIDDM